MTHAVAIVPAYNRADTVGATVAALRTVTDVVEVIVVDDGSSDRTAALAASAGARVVELPRNRGKGEAVAAGIGASGAPDVYLLIDADLGATAALADALLHPVAAGEADMTIAVLAEPASSAAATVPTPKTRAAESARSSAPVGSGASPAMTHSGRFGKPSASGGRTGFGLVKRFAARVLFAETGRTFAEPLSGQRAVRGPLLRSLELAPGFGLELGLTLDAASRGASIREVDIGFTHRHTGRDFSGIAHRARIGRHVYRAAVSRIGRSKANSLLAASLLGDAKLPLVGPKSPTGSRQRRRASEQGARR